MKHHCLTFLACLSLLAPAYAQSPASFLQQPMPDWYVEGFTRGHLNIPLLMKQGFSRLEAVEIQNQMKDLLEAMPAYQRLEKQNQAQRLFTDPDPMVLASL